MRRARAVRMRDVMTHRGPDEAGLRCDGRAALAHRRLSIVDLSTGQQPLSNEDGSRLGRLQRRNLQPRRPARRARSARPRLPDADRTPKPSCTPTSSGAMPASTASAACSRSRSGTRRGAGCCSSRDRLGVKPLYWARLASTLLFGSEIKAILASGLVEPHDRIEAALPELLSTRSIAGEETLFRGIHKLLPGHLLVFEDGARQHAPVLGRPGSGHGAMPAALRRRKPASRFGELLEESVRLRLMSDVPLGVFLSGGIDSSAIAALMARLIDRPLQTFSVAFKERAFNELEYARQVARAIGAESHEIVIDDRDFFDALPRLVWHEDEPIAHPSSVPLYFVSALARRQRDRRPDRRRQRRAAGRLRQVPARRLELAGGTRLRAAAAPRGAGDGLPRQIVPCLPGRCRPLRAPIVSRHGPRRPTSMVFDNFAAHPAGGSAAPARAGRSRAAATSARAYGAVDCALRRARTAPARCSIGCSTRTSRPTSSSC